MAQDRRVSIRPCDAEELRRTALQALASQPDRLVIDLRDHGHSAATIQPLREVQDAARQHRCGLTIELAVLTIDID